MATALASCDSSPPNGTSSPSSSSDGALLGEEHHHWLTTVNEILSGHPLPNQLFFKVPPNLRPAANDDPYHPILFNFGLWHGPASFHGIHHDSSSALLFKLQAAKEFRSVAKSKGAFDDLVKELSKAEEVQKSRSCYGQSTIKGANVQNLKATATAMALDVVTVYMAARKKIGFHPPCVRSIVRSDAVLLENQLPIFAFRCLLRTMQSGSSSSSAEIDVALLVRLYACRNNPFIEGWNFQMPDSDNESLLGCIYDGWVGKRKRTKLTMESSSHRHERRLDRLATAPAAISHSSSFPYTGINEFSESEVQDEIYDTSGLEDQIMAIPETTPARMNPLHSSIDRNVIPIPSRSSCLLSAAHLYRRGIRFKAAERPLNAASWSLANCIHFEDKSGTLALPKLTVFDGTRRFLLNLMAFEHTSRFTEACTLLSFVCFMDMLINSEEDVELLVESGVVVNELGSHAQLAAMWNGLTTGYPFRLSSDHEKLARRVRRESKRRWRRWGHTFRDSYYERRPWLVLSAVAAIVLLVLTFLQTVYTVIN